MLSARYRRAVATALAWLQGQADEVVIDLCDSEEPNAVDANGEAAADDVGSSHFSARQVGAWIRTHAKYELTDRWDWYERITRALSGLVRDGRVHMGGLGRFRLADANRVTVSLTLRWKDTEDMQLEVSSSCTDGRLREIVSKKTGGQLPADKISLVYPAGFDSNVDTMDALPDDTVLTLSIVKTKKHENTTGPLSSAIISNPNASPIDEVFEHEAEGTEGWNKDNDGWVNLVVNENEEVEEEEEGDETHLNPRSAKTPKTKKSGQKNNDAGEARSEALRSDAEIYAAIPRRSGADTVKINLSTSSAPAPPPALAPSVVFDEDNKDDGLNPSSQLFSPIGAAKARLAAHSSDDDVDEDLSVDVRSGRKHGRTSLDSDNKVSPIHKSIVDLTGDDDVDNLETLDDDDSKTDSALSGSEEYESDDDDDSRRLHTQVLQFMEANGSNCSDKLIREQCRKTVEACVRRVFPKARLEAFGSGASGLALKEADIDLVVLGVGPTTATAGGGFNKHDRTELVSILRKIEKQLRRDKVVVKAQGIYTAKVPIVKAHTTGNNQTGFALDLTVGATNGLKAVTWIKTQLHQFPELRPLVLVLKKLLKTHGLDDASTGGCGGYLLVSLAVAHLKMKQQGVSTPSKQNRKLPDLGRVVTSFLRRFGGDTFDYARSAVAANRSSGIIKASEIVVTNGPYGKRPFILCEDPQEVGRNITASAYRFKEVRALFRATAEAIAAEGDLTFLPEVAEGGYGGLSGGNGHRNGGGGGGGVHTTLTSNKQNLGDHCFNCKQAGHWARDCHLNTQGNGPQRGFKMQWHRGNNASFPSTERGLRDTMGGKRGRGEGGGSGKKAARSAGKKSPGRKTPNKNASNSSAKKKGKPSPNWNFGVRSKSKIPSGDGSGKGGGGRGWATE